MSICSNCYSGCAEITSDKCVKYTGVDIPLLGIQKGDSINYVEAAIMGFLVSTLDGSGIKYELEAGNLCTLISDEFIGCTDITVVDITNALSKGVCTLQGLITANTADILTNTNNITAINAAYIPDCIPGITGTEGAHDVLQAVIDEVCAIASDLSTNYVTAGANLDAYIANYISIQNSGTTGLKDRMVPYTVVEYYGPLTNFDVTGAGLDKTGEGGQDWREIYLCNGANPGVPDKRGRIAVGTTTGMGGGAFPSATDPLISGNPTYALYTTTGSNIVTLTTSQIPSHTHTATTTTAGSHSHLMFADVNDNEEPMLSTSVVARRFRDGDFSENYSLRATTGNTQNAGVTSTHTGHTHTVTVTAQGGGGSHNNIPPVLACHYIIYIPSA